MNSIIIVGAGAAGLIAGRELSAAGFHVTILEARDRVGGRIHSFQPAGFSAHIEAGAEFIHGRLPVTIGLLEHYGIRYENISGGIYTFRDGELRREEQFIENHKLLEKHLQGLHEDISVTQFLANHFPGDEYLEFREGITAFVEGYDAADANRASALAFRDEWMTEDDEDQFRIPDGYSSLMNAIADECRRNSCEIHLNAVVTHISLKTGKVEVKTAGGKKFQGDRVILTLPVEVMHTSLSNGSLRINPSIEPQRQEFSRLGQGNVIKTVIEFSRSLLDDDSLNKTLRSIPAKSGWIITDETIGAWWPRADARSVYFTGWVAGGAAKRNGHHTAAEWKTIAVSTLAKMFGVDTAQLEKNLIAIETFDWSTEIYSQGAYCYATVGEATAIEHLNEPVDRTLYFAGEGLQRFHKGTVEAALVSGLEVAARIRAELR